MRNQPSGLPEVSRFSQSPAAEGSAARPVSGTQPNASRDTNGSPTFRCIFFLTQPPRLCILAGAWVKNKAGVRNRIGASKANEDMPFRNLGHFKSTADEQFPAVCGAKYLG